MASGRVSKVKGKVVDIPNAPTIGTATAGGESVSITFTATEKGGPTRSYIAKSNPGNITATGSTSPISVTGLTVGTSYTISVAGVNETGTGEYSSSSNSAVPVPDTAYESIATATGTGSSGVINFTSIPNTFKHLQIRISALPTAGETIACRAGNGSIDTGSNYTRHSLNGNGTDAAAYGVANFSYLNIYGFRILSDTTNPIVAVVDILDYADTNKFKTFRILSGTDKNGSGEVALNSGLWRSTSAIDQLRIFAEGSGNWATSSHFALYGIKGA